MERAWRTRSEGRPGFFHSGSDTDPLDPTPAYEAAAVLAGFPRDAVDALLDLTGPGSDSPQILVEVRQMGGATARRGDHESAFCARDTAYSLLTVGIAGTHGLESHSAAVLEAMSPWTGGHRMPNFTFDPEDYVDAYDESTRSRLRRAIRTYDPHGVLAIGRVLFRLTSDAPRGEGASASTHPTKAPRTSRPGRPSSGPPANHSARMSAWVEVMRSGSSESPVGYSRASLPGLRSLAG